MATRWKPVTLVLLLLILLLTLGLRLYRIDAQSLWNDEGTSVALAQHDLATIARKAAYDIHPPLYYWLLSGWVRVFGTSEFAVRALSAFLGAILVVLVYVLGRLLAGKWAGLAAALLAAINPFQVYYSQEARMYMLLAVWSALLFYAALRWAASSPWGKGPGEGEGDAQRVISPSPQPSPPRERGSSPQQGWGLVYILAGAAGMYTHYAFPMVLLAVNLVVLLDIGLRWRQGVTMNRRTERAKGDESFSSQPAEAGLALSARRFIAGPLAHWLTLQVAVALLFLPWLPTALRQLTTWPAVTEQFSFTQAYTQVFQTLIIGSPSSASASADAFGVFLLWTLVLIIPVPRQKIPYPGAGLSNLIAYLTPVLWFLLPVAMMFALGIFKETYLKFLLIVSPAPCLLMGRLVASPLSGWRRSYLFYRLVDPALRFSIMFFALFASGYILHQYFSGDPAYARDDYRTIAAYVEAVGQPGDAVLLNAPGQQEVFGYYYRGDLPVYPLPENRPLDPAATEASLENLAQPGARVYAVLWATDESDPDRFVEGWLDTHAYKALDSWHGNVRLVVYAMPERTPQAPDQELNVHLRNPETGDEITLVGYSLLNDRLAAGDIAQITLFWQAGETPARRYKVFLHVLDGGNHIVGQHDAEPGGGARLTTLWQPGEAIVDNHGLPIHPATPPGEYRVEVGMYDAETGQRLITPEGEGQIWLEPLQVERPPEPAAIAILGMQHTATAKFGALAMLGYDAYRLGFAHQPDAPLRPGDVLHINLYWRAESQPSGDWQVTIGLVDSEGQEWASIMADPVGGYATSKWLAGDIVRGQFNLSLPGDIPAGRYRLSIQPAAPDGTLPRSFQSEPLTIQR
jgi:mannosyltransferase